MSVGREIELQVAEYNQNAIVLAGLEEALIGYAEVECMPIKALYDSAKIIEIFMADGMTHEEAVEFFEFNVLGLCVGENAPVFATFLR